MQLSSQKPTRRTHATLTTLLECSDVRAGSVRHALAGIDEIVIGAGEARTWTRHEVAGRRRLTLQLRDRHLAETAACLRRDRDGWILEESACLRRPRVNGQPTGATRLIDRDLIEVGHTFFYFRDQQTTTEDEPLDVAPGDLGAGPHTLTSSLQSQLSLMEKLARSSVSVLLLGESGTGKEVAARMLHRLSGRSGQLVAVNCGALPETLIEAELFGYRKGSFSGAAEDRVGLIRSSDGGTLFLDEIGDLRPSSQAALLRVLQEREVMPVGGTRAVRVDLRVVAATHRDLDDLVARNAFRSDLLARLRAFTMRLPPLRDRFEDMGLLIASLLDKLDPERKRPLQIHPDAARTLLRYHWPLNIRELENCLHAAFVLADDRIEPDHLSETLRPRSTAAPATRLRSFDEKRRLTELDVARREAMLELLAKYRGNISAVARDMGKARVQIRRWIKRYDIDVTSATVGTLSG